MLKRLLVAGTLALAPTLTHAETIRATIVTGHPPVFRWVRMITESFIPEVNKRLEGTGYEMEFDPQFGGAIAGVGEELETVELGLAELGVIQSLFDPAKLAVQNVSYYTPFVSADHDLVAKVMLDLHRNDPRMQRAYEENGIHYLGAPVAIDDYLLLTKFPVNSLADLEGRKIAAPGPAVNWLSGTGAVGVSGNLTTYYNELQTGVYDGVIVFASAALPGKLYEVAPHITRLGLGAQYAAGLGANADWWDGLPEEVQTALTEAADATGEWYLADLGTAVETAFAKMAEAGATVAVAPDELRQAWADKMDNAAKTWATTLDAEGREASGVLQAYMDAMRAGGAEPLRDWDKE